MTLRSPRGQITQRARSWGRTELRKTWTLRTRTSTPTRSIKMAVSAPVAPQWASRLSLRLARCCPTVLRYVAIRWKYKILMLVLPPSSSFGINLFVCVAPQVKVVSPKHRLIKVDSQEFGRCKVPLSPITVQEEPVSNCLHLCPYCGASLCQKKMFFVVKVVPSAPAALDPDTDYSDPFDVRPDPRGRPNLEPKPALTDCCSYMEPFEAQRIISGVWSDCCQ